MTDRSGDGMKGLHSGGHRGLNIEVDITGGTTTGGTIGTLGEGNRRRLRGRRGLGWERVKIGLRPKLEHQQLPELVRVVAHALQVLVDERLYDRRLEDTLRPQPI